MFDWVASYSSGLQAALWAPLVLLVFVLALTLTHLVDRGSRSWVWKVLLGIAVLMFVVQAPLALSWAPAERYMGDTGRILYMHVPLISLAMALLVINFGASIAYLMRPSMTADAVAEASVSVAMMYGVLGTLLGAIWAKPTWGTWWTWDPRLTTSAILLVIYTGYLALRRFVDEQERRATWSAVVGILAAVNIPVTYFSVRWWRSIHQVQSNPSTVDPQMVMVLRWSYTMFIALLVVLLYQRTLDALEARKRESTPP